MEALGSARAYLARAQLVAERDRVLPAVMHHLQDHVNGCKAFHLENGSSQKKMKNGSSQNMSQA